MRKKFVFTTFHKTCAIFLAALLIITAGSFVQYRQGMELLRQESVNSANGAHRYMPNVKTKLQKSSINFPDL